MKHLIITPFFNEEPFIERYITSVINQTKLPDALILVDDNSTDNSAKIIQELIKEYNWIKYIYHPSSGKKVQGSKVIAAFNFGLSNIDYTSFDIISKFDADLELPSNYVEQINVTIKQDERIAICGGVIAEEENGIWVSKVHSDYHIRGALKSYNAKFFKDIGGLKPVLGWDGIDEMEAFYLKWKTFNVSNLIVKHFRPASKDYNPIKMNYKIGIANYKNGGNFALAFIRMFVRMTDRPYFLAGFSFMTGYSYALLSGMDRNVSKELAKFINSFHSKRLFNLKRY